MFKSWNVSWPKLSAKRKEELTPAFRWWGSVDHIAQEQQEEEVMKLLVPRLKGKLIYVACNVIDNNHKKELDNIAFGLEYAKKIADLGYVPIIPVAMFPFKWNYTRKQCMLLKLHILKRCDALFFCRNWREARDEIIVAQLLGMPIFHSIEELTVPEKIFKSDEEQKKTDIIEIV